VIKTISPLASVKIDTALDGLDCCKKIEENPKHYQLILMDLIMPEMNGFNATIRIRNLGFTIPIVALTGDKNTISMKQECDIAGMNGFIEKPLTLKKFKSILSEQNIIGS
jgi:CheY-like chemotaxis protein